MNELPFCYCDSFTNLWPALQGDSGLSRCSLGTGLSGNHQHENVVLYLQNSDTSFPHLGIIINLEKYILLQHFSAQNSSKALIAKYAPIAPIANANKTPPPSIVVVKYIVNPATNSNILALSLLLFQSISSSNGGWILGSSPSSPCSGAGISAKGTVTSNATGR